MGISPSDVQYFRTPLGDIPIDLPTIRQLLTIPQVQIMDAAHWQEHSLEVQLPFLQTVLGEFELVPILIGDATVSEVQQVVDLLWGGPETLVVISTDLSHFHDYAEAKRRDSVTCKRVLDRDTTLSSEDACGAYALNGFLHSNHCRTLTLEQLAMSNSADTAGDRDESRNG